MNRKERRKKARRQSKGGSGTSPEKLLEAAVADLRAARLEGADANLRDYVPAKPDHAAALHPLGLAAYPPGRLEEPAVLTGPARRMDAANPPCPSNLRFRRRLPRRSARWRLIVTLTSVPVPVYGLNEQGLYASVNITLL